MTRKCPGSSLVSLRTDVAALLQACKPYFRLRSSRGRDPVRACSFDAGAPVHDGTVKLVRTAPPYRVRQLRKSQNSAHDSLPFRDMKNTAVLIADLLLPDRHAVLFCKASKLLFCSPSFRHRIHAQRRLTFVVHIDIYVYVYVKRLPLQLSWTISRAIATILLKSRGSLPQRSTLRCM